jgi:hypothetical protein
MPPSVASAAARGSADAWCNSNLLQEPVMNNSGKAPTLWVWVVSLVLYVVALAAYFGVVKINPEVAAGCWIIGLGLLLLACRVRGL